MDDQQPPYAQIIDRGVHVVEDFHRGLTGIHQLSFITAGDEQPLATLQLKKQKIGGRTSFATIDFGGRRFSFEMPPDRTLSEVVWEWWNTRISRRCWRAGSGFATELQEVTDERREPVGTFQRDGVGYKVACELGGFLGFNRTASVIAENRVVANIDYDPEDKKVMLVSLERPLRLDVIVIAYHLYSLLTYQRGSTGGAPGGGAGAAGGGGGGDGGGGGC